MERVRGGDCIQPAQRVKTGSVWTLYTADFPVCVCLKMHLLFLEILGRKIRRTLETHTDVKRRRKTDWESHRIFLFFICHLADDHSYI